eukprot:6538794-Prymnesium_polylepis.1
MAKRRRVGTPRSNRSMLWIRGNKAGECRCRRRDVDRRVRRHEAVVLCGGVGKGNICVVSWS